MIGCNRDEHENIGKGKMPNTIIEGILSLEKDIILEGPKDGNEEEINMLKEKGINLFG